MQEYAAAWVAAGCPKEAGLFMPAGRYKETSTVWLYFFSPKAAELAKDVLRKPSLKVEACREPDLNSLREVKL
jgi:hypothetical protein